MRARRAGLIVNVSSIGAWITLPGGGYSFAAKAALEGASGALRKELAPLGIHLGPLGQRSHRLVVSRHPREP
jgi:short-subunit dehydrogenase